MELKKKLKTKEPFLPPVVPGRYRIENVIEKNEMRYPALLLVLVNYEDKRYGMFIQLSADEEISSNTNLGRLIQAFGTETGNWVGKMVQVEIDAQGRKHVRPV